jgi:hypothetical protein
VGRTSWALRAGPSHGSLTLKGCRRKRMTVAKREHETGPASGGYPWTVIKVDDRDEYLAALEAASVDSDIRPFATFVAVRVRELMGEVASNV